MSDRVEELFQPVGVGGLLARTVALLREQAFGLLLTGVVCLLPQLLLGVLLDHQAREFRLANGPEACSHDATLAVYGGALVRLGYLLLWCAVSHMVARRYAGERISVFESLGALRVAGLRLLGATLLVVLRLLLVFVVTSQGTRIILEWMHVGTDLAIEASVPSTALVVLWVVLNAVFVPQVLLNEGLGVWAACKRSAQLLASPGPRGRALALAVLVIVAVGRGEATEMLFDLTQATSPGDMSAIPAQAMDLLWEAFWWTFTTTACVVFYFDARVRNEGLTQAQLAAEPGAAR